MGQHNDRRSELREFLAAPAEQIPQQPLFDVENIAGSIRQKAALQSLEHLGIAAQSAAHGVFGGIMPIAHHGVQLAAELGIAEHLEMGVEDRRVLRAEFASDSVAIDFDLRAGGSDRLVETVEFIDDRVARDEPPRDSEPLSVHHQRFADRHAGRNGNPLKSLHGVFVSRVA